MTFTADFRSTATHIQFRPIGGADWVNFIPLDGLSEGGSATLTGLQSRLPESIYNASRTVTAADAGRMQAFSDTIAMIAALPPLLGTDAEVYNFMNIGVAPLTIDPNATDLIEGGNTLVLRTGEMAAVWPNASKDGWRAVVSRQEHGIPLYKNKLTNVSEWKLPGLIAFKSLHIRGFASHLSAVPLVNISFRVGDNAGVIDETLGNYRRYHLHGIEGTAAPTTVNYNSHSRFQLHSATQMGAVGVANAGVNFDIWLDRFNEPEQASFMCEYQGGTSTGLIDFGTVKGRHMPSSVLGSVQIKATDGNLAVIDVTVTGYLP